MNEQQQPRQNNTCLDVGQIIAWHDGALPPQEANAVMAHLADCARCAAEERALLSDRQQVLGLLTTLDPPPAANVGPAVALARFQQRFHAQHTGTFLHDSNWTIHPGTFRLSSSEREGTTFTPERPSNSIDMAPFGVPPVRGVPRQHRLSRWVTLIAAVVVIGALVVTDLLIFQAQTPSTATHPTLAPPIGPLGKPVTVHAQANGLEATMQITSGPYFLSEMLEVQLSFTNHSPDTLWLEPYSEKVCAPSYFRDWFTVTMTGGGKPSDSSLQQNMADLSYPCEGMLGNGPIHTGEVWVFTRYIVLTNSGRITLSAQLGMAKVVPDQNAGHQVLPNSNPLAGHWPSLQISVQAGIPSDRLITGQQRGTQVTIHAPSLALGHLIYAYVLRCDLSLSSGSTLAPLTLQQPPCGSGMQHKNPADRFVKWTYVVGAFGYAMFSGSIHR